MNWVKIFMAGLLVVQPSEARRPHSSVKKNQKNARKNRGLVKKCRQKKNYDQGMPSFEPDIKRGSVVEHCGPTKQTMPFFDSNFEKLIQEVDRAPGGLHGKKARKEILKDTLRQIKENHRYEGSPRHYVKVKYLGQPQKILNTVLEVQEGDALDIAQTLCQQGSHPLILEMFDVKVPNGGVLEGQSAQEDGILYRSNLYPALIFAKKWDQNFIHEWGGIYFPNVRIFKNNEQKAYSALPQSFSVDVVASPALDLRNTSKELVKYENRESVHLRDKSMLLHAKLHVLESDYEKSMKRIMRAQFRIADLHKHDTLLLSALGCGVFKNDPNDVARFYKEVLQEKEFCGRFKKIIFGITSVENCEVFKRVFSKLALL